MAGSRIWRILSRVYVAVKATPRYKGVLFWLFVFPLLFYTIMVLLWARPGHGPVSAGLVLLDHGNASRLVARALSGLHVLKLKRYPTPQALWHAIRRGRVYIGFVVPRGFSSNVSAGYRARIIVYVSSSGWGYYEGIASAALSYVASVLRSNAANAVAVALHGLPGGEAERLARLYRFVAEPLEPVVKRYSPPLLSTPAGLRAFYAIGMVGVEALFIGLGSGVFAVIDMKRERTLGIVLSSPMRPSDVFLSLSLEALYAVAVSALALFCYSLVLGARYHLSPAEAAAMALLIGVGTLFTIGLGLLLAPLARSQEAANAIVTGLAFPLMFMGGLVIPGFLLPRYLRSVAEWYPLSMAIKAVRDMAIYGVSPLAALREAAPAFVAAAVVYALGFRVFSRLLSAAVEE